MNDQAIEQEIIAKGKTAPRVTPTDIEANIQHIVYFTAAQGLNGAVRAGESDEFAEPVPALGLLTFCVLVLKNGFTVTGESACASPENFDAEIGQDIARENAIQKVWPLMGYALKERLHELASVAQQPAPGAAHAGYSAMPPHQQRVVDEAAELDGKSVKLLAFFDTAIFASLGEDEQSRLRQQYHAMTCYSAILGERIDAFAA